MSSVQLIAASAADISSIKTLAREIWPDCYGSILSQEQISYMLDLFYTEESLLTQMQNGQDFFLIRQHEQTIGFLAVQCDYKTAGNARLHKLYLKTATQGKGIGQKVWQEVEHYLKEQQQLTIELNVNRYNPAKHFYDKCGFTVSETVDIAIGNGYLMEDFVMVKNLTTNL
ncbi:GNAT family N-acetyltransferase [Flavobacterium sp.]|uniref:GNAT family N-acetyltransferase n=1 Tax=Flavobacterium sp. TaxID=239 RepID=UPI00260C400F|nr:GNAT family N-acetyltransferase [Flavobacterium sp.]